VSLTSVPVYLITGESLSCLLSRGKNVIEVSSPLCGKWCGLIPVGHPANHVTTTGLVYNLSDDPLEFGQMISTSNAFSGSPTVTVETDEPLLWTMGIEFLL
jgi:thiamine pyrophosphokinase